MPAGRQDPRVQGIRYVHYGAIEHGNDGLLAWKRRFGFVPLRFSGKPVTPPASQPEIAITA
jgi:hypothetical protein